MLVLQIFDYQGERKIHKPVNSYWKKKLMASGQFKFKPFDKVLIRTEDQEIKRVLKSIKTKIRNGKKVFEIKMF